MLQYYTNIVYDNDHYNLYGSDIKNMNIFLKLLIAKSMTVFRNSVLFQVHFTIPYTKLKERKV